MIVTYHGDVETTSFFMTQIEEGLQADGYQVCPLFYNEDIEKWLTGKEELLRGAFFLTFNFAGIYSKDACLIEIAGEKDVIKETVKEDSPETDKKEEEKIPRKVMLVDRFMMRCINIIVDHPYHYHDFLYEQIRFRRTRYLQFCIDKQHIAYMKRYFPEIALGGFLPSGGTGFADGVTAKTSEVHGSDVHSGMETMESTADKMGDMQVRSWNERPIDILFPATYVEPAFFDVFIDRNGPEYSAFYHSIIDEALANPKAKLEDIVKRRMEEEIEEGFTEAELRLTLGHIQFLDYTVRYQRRAEVVRALVDSDENVLIHLTILGSGWENFIKTLRHPERVALLPYADSREVLRLMTESKMVLNVLPSFHEGAHDRIFNAMLCGAVCVTDSNPYLDEMLRDGENALLYRYEEIGESQREFNLKPDMDKESNEKESDGIIARLQQYLRPENAESLEKIAAAGRKLAEEHTWKKRVSLIEQAFSDFEVANDFLME